MYTRLLTIAITGIFISTTAFAAGTTPPPPDPGKQASDLYNSDILNKYGTAKGLKNTVLDPMNSGGTGMKTLDGKTTFSAGSIASQGQEVLKIVVVPSAARGEIASINIQQADPGGTLGPATNALSAAPGKAGVGVCNDGFIACTSGTFDNCVYLKWTTHPNTKKVSLTGMPSVHSLTSCFCFSNYCATVNNTLMSSMETITSKIGSGVLGAFLSGVNGWSVTSASASSNTISYYGSRVDNVSGDLAATNASAANPIQYSPATPETVHTFSQEADILESMAVNPHSMARIYMGTANNAPKTISRLCVLERYSKGLKPDGTNNLDDRQLCETVPEGYTCEVEPYEDKWDGRYFRKDGMLTGYTMFNIRKRLNGVDELQKWWKRERRHWCYTDEDYDMETPTRRVSENAEHASYSESNSTMTYRDGGISRSYKITDMPPDTPCEATCKVKVVMPDSKVGTEGAAVDLMEQAALVKEGFMYFYRDCEGGEGGICQREDGDIIMEPCTCSDAGDMNLIFGAFEAIGTAKRDVICSSVKDPPKGATTADPPEFNYDLD
ncbi:MAG: hypothetical protein RBQ99_02850 [Trichlorobacter sp.]|nr:hypothetical protein [Trichlorobacter sp.]